MSASGVWRSKDIVVSAELMGKGSVLQLATEKEIAVAIDH
jgi:hypothetical protein